MATNSYYTVHLSSDNTLSIVDIRRNAVINRVKVRGVVTNGPVVLGDRCTVMIKDGSTGRGLVFKLPSGAIVDRFVVR